MGNERTVRCPIASGDYTMYTLLRADLLAKRRDPGVSDESGVESIHAFPRCVSCMGTVPRPGPAFNVRKATLLGHRTAVDVRLSEIFHAEGLQCEGGHEP